MRILVISDVHGNIEALNAVLKEPHDAVLFAGDIVDYGPRPKECLQKLKEETLFFVRGNHDNAAGFGVDCRCSPAMHDLSAETRKFTRKVLNPQELKFLANLPLSSGFLLDGKKFFMVHASFSDPLFKYLNPNKISASEIEREFENIDADFVIYGHTHFPILIKRKKNGLILNPGSVGQPRDGDPRASYAVIDTEKNKVDFYRKEYNIEKVARDIKERGLPEKLIDILYQRV